MELGRWDSIRSSVITVTAQEKISMKKWILGMLEEGALALGLTGLMAALFAMGLGVTAMIASLMI
jgi:hypothetical protein